MPPPSPLPRRDGLDASWVRTPDRIPGEPWEGGTYLDFLRARLPQHVDVGAMLADGAFVDGRGRPIHGERPARPSTLIWFYRPHLFEPVLSGPLPILHTTSTIVVVDKPPFLASTPRGTHVQESVVVRLRRAGFPDIAPAHRLDRLTAGVLVLTRERRWRAAYAGVFADGSTTKTYEAIAPHNPALALPLVVENRIEKERGDLQARVVPGAANARTRIELLQRHGRLARYRLTPETGKTHQLRVHMAELGIAIIGDSLYPLVRNDPENTSEPLRLVARNLSFTDPVTGQLHSFTSRLPLRWPDEVGVAH